MLAAYGVDVLDPGVTPRRLLVLAERLPPWARTPGEQWSTEAELLALLVDHLANLTWITLRAAGSKNAPRPRPMPRPRHRAARPAQGRTGPPTATSGPAAASRAGSWAEAAAQLAAIPGVITHRAGDG